MQTNAVISHTDGTADTSAESGVRRRQDPVKRAQEAAMQTAARIRKERAVSRQQKRIAQQSTTLLIVGFAALVVCAVCYWLLPWLRKAVFVLGLAAVLLIGRVALTTVCEGIDDDDEEDMNVLRNSQVHSPFPAPFAHTRKAIGSLVAGVSRTGTSVGSSKSKTG